MMKSMYYQIDTGICAFALSGRRLIHESTQGVAQGWLLIGLSDRIYLNSSAATRLVAHWSFRPYI